MHVCASVAQHAWRGPPESESSECEHEHFDGTTAVLFHTPVLNEGGQVC